MGEWDLSGVLAGGGARRGVGGRGKGGGREAGKGREETDFSYADLVLRTGSAACSWGTAPFAGPAAWPARVARSRF